GVKAKIVTLVGDHCHGCRNLHGREEGPILDADDAFAGRHSEDDVFPTRDTVCILSINSHGHTPSAAREASWSDNHNLSGVCRIDGRDWAKNAMRAARQHSGE